MRAPSLGTVAIADTTLWQYPALRQYRTTLHYCNSSAYAIASAGTILVQGQVLQYCKSRYYTIAITCPYIAAIKVTPLLQAQVLYYGYGMLLHYYKKMYHTSTRAATTLL